MVRKAKRKPTVTADVTVENHGSIYLFQLHTQAARDWVAENVHEPLWFGNALACEPRCAHELAGGMDSDGLIVE